MKNILDQYFDENGKARHPISLGDMKTACAQYSEEERQRAELAINSRNRWRDVATKCDMFLASISPAPPFDARTEAEWLTSFELQAIINKQLDHENCQR